MKFTGRSILSSVVIAGALFAAVASTGDDNSAERVDEGSNGDSAEAAGGDNGGDGGGNAQPETFGVGELVGLGDWQVRVHGVTDPYEGSSEYFTPDPGMRWVAVDVEVTNGSDEPEQVSSLLCFELTDGQNRSHSQALVTGDSVSTPDGEVAAGGSRRGTVVYELPEAVTTLRLNFRCDLWSTGTATINL